MTSRWSLGAACLLSLLAAGGREASAEGPSEETRPTRSAESKAVDDAKSVAQPHPSFGSVARLQARYLSGGMRTVSEGAFLFLPYDFNFAELVELTNNGHDWDVAGEAKLARPIDPTEPWGRAFSAVTRLQVSDMYTPVLGGGLQWNITETPRISGTATQRRMKSLLQVFVKTKAGYAGDADGLIDIYHWYQFPLFSGFYVRGVNTYNKVRNSDDNFTFMQDLIHPVSDTFELFFHHVHRTNRFGKDPEGSQFGIGARLALW